MKGGTCGCGMILCIEGVRGGVYLPNIFLYTK